LSDAIRAVRRERVAMVGFLTAGYPSKQSFRADLESLAAEADVMEIGVPFTDPMADGVTIQRSSLAALAQGVSLKWIIETLKGMPKLRAKLVFMGYMNPMLAYGLEQLACDAAAAGICGFIVPDLPIEESADFERALAPHGLALIRMVTPVTPQARLEQLCRGAQGFVYAVSMTGTTGRSVGHGGVPQETLDYLDRVRKLASVPVCVGFGIREHAQVAALAPHVDGVVVASAAIEAMEKGESPVALLRRLRG
jgi:tryptophan synthase alpha chain